jgi:tripartite-type tricarboxylate transporter receptor subunit TctC
MPDLPTVAESGYPGFEAGLWFALSVPSGTPKPIIDRIHRETVKALQQPDVQTAMARQGLDPEPSTPEELAARISQETAMWAGLIKKIGIRLQ